jgi:hypothetical protein
MSGMNVRIIGSDANKGVAEIDESTGHLVVVDSVHHWVHEGKVFQADFVGEGIADDGSIEILLKIPAGIDIHMSYRALAGGDARFAIFEGPTITDDGTAIIRPNRNRQSSNVTTMTAFHTPTTTDDGTQLNDIFIPGGSGGNATGGNAEVFAKWILKADENYLLRFTNIAGSAKNLGLQVDWFDPASSSP